MPSPDPNLHVNGLATIAREGLRLWLDPVGGNAGPRENFLALAVGSDVLLVDGPLTVDGIDYWEIYPSTRGYEIPLGWAPAAKGDGTPNLTPVQPACPAIDGITVAEIDALAQLGTLACFGHRELALDGVVTCNFGIADGILGGPVLNSNVWCDMDGAISLFGPVITAVPPVDPQHPVFTGNYLVRGHFDDIGANACRQIPFGSSLTVSGIPGDPGAIQECRSFFVVTAAEELTIK